VTKNQKQLTHHKYRPDIDGLRAFAVLAVVAFHAFPRWLKGGFIGVDVFFVISGYLISTIIFKSLDKGAFSFYEFYARRIRRIFPALILVLVACFIFGWFALLPDEYKQLGKHIAAGTGFVSNIVFWRESGYFDNAADTKPLLHLWSLAVEEQFYIVWPLILWFVWKLKFNLITVTVIFAITSFVLNLNGMKQDSVATFYSLQTRFWELLTGSLLAWVELYRNNSFAHLRKKLGGYISNILYLEKQGADDRLLSNALSFFGFLLLAYGFLQLNKGLSFPGKWALIPVIGTLLLLMGGSSAWVNRTILSNKIAVWIGLISFPLYLWHWPLLSFARIVGNSIPNRNIRAGVIVLSVTLAYLTYKFVEHPVRFEKYNKIKVAILLLLTGIIGFIGYCTFRYDGLSFRKSISGIAEDVQNLKMPIFTRQSDGSCQNLLGLDQKNKDIICITKSSAPEVIIVGDSHAMALNSAAYLNKFKLNTLLIAVHGCVPLVGYSILENKGANKPCDDLPDLVQNTISKYKSIKTIILLTRGPFYFTGDGYGIEGKSTYSIKSDEASLENQAEMFQHGFSNFISILEKNKLDIIFVIDMPELGENPSGCFFQRPTLMFINHSLSSNCSQDYDKVLFRQKIYRNVVGNIKQANPNIKVYDPLRVFCDNFKCYSIRNGNLYYFDDDHISISGSFAVLSDMNNQGLLP